MEKSVENQKLAGDSYRRLCAVGAIAFFVGAAPALAQSAADKSAPHGSTHSAAPSMDKKDAMKPGMSSMAGGGDMRGSMMGMMKGMESMKMSGDTDRDFAMMMKMHHQGAIDMAQMELKNGKDPKMKKMAKRIIEAQQKEIKEFDQWLAKGK